MGILLVLVSSLCFVISTYFGKIVTLNSDMTAVITSFGRFFLGSIIMLFYMLLNKKSFKPNNLKMITIRAVTNGLTIIMTRWALEFTTITNTTMFNMSYPIYVILFAPFISKEKSGKSTYFYLSAIMLGSYIVSNPSIGNINKGDVIAILSAVIAGISTIYLKKASVFDSSHVIVFYVMLIGTITNLPFVSADLFKFDFSVFNEVFLAALFGFLGQVFLTWGYYYVDSATGAMVASGGIAMAAVIGSIFLDEPLNLRVILGISLITLSLIGISGFFKPKIKKYQNM